jgi:hypothetical protein
MKFAREVVGSCGGRILEHSNGFETGTHCVPKGSAQVPGMTVSLLLIHHLSCRIHILPGRGCLSLGHQAMVRISKLFRKMAA